MGGAIALLFLSEFGAATGAPVRTGGSDSARVVAAVNPMLLAAESSLAHGAGPARGAASTCAPTAGGSAACSVAPSAHPAASSAPVWSDLTKAVGSNVPTARYLGAMAYDPADHYVLLFGGYGGSLDSDTWSYANGVWTQLNPTGSPEGRYTGSLVWDAADNYMLMFGGYDLTAAQVLNSTWSYLNGTWTNVTPSVGPAPRWRQAMTYDPTDGYVVMFGGTNLAASTIYSDTWSWKAGVWTKLSPTGSPPGRYRAQMVWDAADGYAVEFGGCTSSSCPDQSTWTYVNDTWTSVNPATKPTARVYYAFDYDAAQGYVLMYGGAETSGMNVGASDTWSFLNGTWTQLTSVGTAPPARGYVMTAFDQLDNYTLMWGGDNPASQTMYYNNTYAFGPAVIGSFVATRSVLDLGQSTQLNATPLASQGVLNYTYSGLPAGCTGQNASVITCTPTSLGAFRVGVTINSTAGTSTSKYLSLAVNGDPQVTSYTTTHSVVTAGSTFALAAAATNGTTPYRYTYSGLPAGCSTSNHPYLNCTPTGTGNFTVQLTVTDGANYSVAQSLAVTVNAKPGVGTFKATPATIDLGQSSTIAVTVSGGTAPYTYSYVGVPTGCTAGNVSSFACAPSATGPDSITVNVSDVFGWYSKAVVLLTVNGDPQVDAFAANPVTFDLGGTTTIWLNASQGTGALSYSYSGLPTGCNLGVAATGACSPSVAGSYTVTGTATDSLGFPVHATLTIVVNALPVVAAVNLTPASIDAGQTTKLSVGLTGGTAPFSYSFTGLPLGCSSTTTATFNCTVSTANTYTIVASVTDKFHQSSQLAATLTVNADPAVASFTATVNPVEQGSPTTLEVSVTGGSGGFSYAYTNLPAGCASANASAVVCTPTASGSFNVSVTATDSLGKSTTGQVVLTVQAPASTNSGGGLSGSPLLYVFLAIIVVAAIALVLLLRKPKPPAPAPAAKAPAPTWSEENADTPTN